MPVCTGAGFVHVRFSRGTIFRYPRYFPVSFRVRDYPPKISRQDGHFRRRTACLLSNPQRETHSLELSPTCVRPALLLHIHESRFFQPEHRHTTRKTIPRLPWEHAVMFLQLIFFVFLGRFDFDPQNGAVSLFLHCCGQHVRTSSAAGLAG